MNEPTPPPVEGRRFLFSRIAHLNSWPQASNVPGAPFCLLLLVGDVAPDLADLESFTARAVSQGMVYLCVWGSASEWIEEVVDEIYVDTTRAQSSRLPLITTAHAELQEAVMYFEEDTRAPEGLERCGLWWVVAIGDSDPSDVVLHELEDRHPVGRLEW